MMRMRRLDTTGTRISEFGVGAYAFGLETDVPTAHAILDRYLELGGNHVDVADSYGKGASERIVGAWLAERGVRDEIVLSTKIGQPMGDGPNEAGLSAPRLHRAVRASLERLRTDHVDLLYLHCWDPLTPIEETLQALQQLVEAGLVRYIGVSNYLPSQLQRAVLLQRFAGRAPVVALQAQYSLLVRQVEWELTSVCDDEGVGLVTWSALAGGWLAGAFSPDEPPIDHPRDRSIFKYERRDVPRTWRIVDAVREVAGRHEGATMAQVALAWILGRPGISSTLLGPSTVQQLEENVASADLSLAADDLSLLEEASDPGLPEYPHGFAEQLARPRQ
jgi:aryl-alcohol dehydrogenase-like predicted oxidoreductase